MRYRKGPLYGSISQAKSPVRAPSETVSQYPAPRGRAPADAIHVRAPLEWRGRVHSDEVRAWFRGVRLCDLPPDPGPGPWSFSVRLPRAALVDAAARLQLPAVSIVRRVVARHLAGPGPAIARELAGPGPGPIASRPIAPPPPVRMPVPGPGRPVAGPPGAGPGSSTPQPPGGAVAPCAWGCPLEHARECVHARLVARAEAVGLGSIARQMLNAGCGACGQAGCDHVRLRVEAMLPGGGFR